MKNLTTSHFRKISVVVPIFNKSQTLRIYLDRLIESLKKLPLDYEVVLIDDGSQDNSQEIVRDYENKQVKIFKYEKNQGKGFALWHGFYQSKGELVAFLDADLDLPPEQIKLYLDLMELFKADIIIGSKRHSLSQVNYPPFRRFLSWGYQMIIRLLYGLKVRDTQVGLKLFRRRTLEDILPRLTVKQFAFDLEMLVVAHQRGYRIAEAPVILNYNFTSTINFKAVRRILKDTLAIFYRRYLLKYYLKIHSQPGKYKLEK